MTNPRPWKALDPRETGLDGWVVIDADDATVARLDNGTYESDKAAAELIVELVNEVKP